MRQKRIKRLGYKELSKKTNYTVWTIGRFYSPRDYEEYYSDEIKSRMYIEEIKNWDELDMKISKLDNKNTVFILAHIKENWQEYGFKLLELFTKYDVDYVMKFTKQTISYNKIYSKWDVFSTYAAARLRLAKKRCKSLKYKKPDYIVLGALSQIPCVPYAGLRSKYIFTHHDDVEDTFKSNKVTKKKYAVFMDQYLPFHQEIRKKGLPRVSKNKYRDDVMALFKYLKDFYNVEDVVVAAHPNADMQKYEDYFHPFPVRQDESATLVRNAKFVIGHYSKSLNYCAIFGKPVGVFSTSEMRHNVLGQRCQEQAAFMGRHHVTVSAKKGIEYIDVGINKKRYNHIRKYVLGMPYKNTTWRQIYSQIIKK